jgi:hypothetical protein
MRASSSKRSRKGHLADASIGGALLSDPVCIVVNTKDFQASLVEIVCLWQDRGTAVLFEQDVWNLLGGKEDG